VRVAGRLVTGASGAALRETRRRIGMIFQQFNLVRRASVLENVLAGRLGYVSSLPSVLGHFPAADRRRAHDCLTQVGLAHFGARRADTLSGGEQQRVAIARALAHSPRVVLADEPTGNLDTRSGEMVMELLARLHSELQITLVLVTHDEWIAERADRVLRLADGRLVNDSAGPVAEELTQ
jgi:phosphonate transport system ATP-binding protein